MDEDSPLLQLCVNACYSPDPFVAVKAITILARVACYWYVHTNGKTQKCLRYTGCPKSFCQVAV